MADEEVLELQIRDNAAEAASGLSSLAETLTKVKNALGKGLNLKSTINGLEKLKNAVNTGLEGGVLDKLERLADSLERIKSTGGMKISGLKDVANQMNVTDSLSEAKEAVQQTATEVTEAVDAGMKDVESRSQGTAGRFASAWSWAKEKISEVWSNLNSVKEAANDGSHGALFESLKTGIEKVSSSIKTLLGDFARIVKYRVIRSIIKNITEAFTTGVENVYNYSKAIGSSLAPQMNAAASTMLQFKNSIGAAVAPLIQQLVPVLQTVVNWAIQVINVLNQIFALLNGQSTWTKALYKPVDAFDKTKKKAKGAGGAIKELLADWDELNIIQSESGGGGGGGGINLDEYTKMFEETNKFDDFLKDNFESIWGTVKKIGAALLTWKLSKAFTGILGKLFKLATGGLLLSVGIDLSYTAGYDMGLNGLNTGNILTAIGGVLAAGLGGSIITSALGFGGGIGLAIGVGVAIVATLVGYIQGQKELADKSKWGNLQLTHDQIERFVKGQFTFDVDAEINVLDGVVDKNGTAKEMLDAKIEAFKKSLTDATIQASIHVDPKETGATVTQAVTDAKEAIKAVEGVLNANGEGLTVLLKKFEFKDEEGKDISKELLENITIADKSVKTYFNDIGRRLSDYVKEGEKQGWSEGITEAALALLAREQQIFDEAERLKGELDFSLQMDKSKDSIISKETALEQLEVQKKLLSDYTEKAKEALQSEYDTNVGLAALAQAEADSALKDANEALERGDKDSYNKYMKMNQDLQDAANTYTETAKAALAAMDNVDDKLKGTKEKMAKDWIEVLKKVYGPDFMNALKKFSASDIDWNNDTWNNNDKFANLVKEGDVTKAGDYLKDYITQQLMGADPNGIVQYVLEELNGNVFDLLTDEMKLDLFESLEQMTGDPSRVEEILQRAFGLTSRDVGEIYQAWLSKKQFEPVADIPVEYNVIDEDDELGIMKDVLDGEQPHVVVISTQFEQDYDDVIEEWIDLDDEGNEITLTITPIMTEPLEDVIEEWVDLDDFGEEIRPIIDPINKQRNMMTPTDLDALSRMGYGSFAKVGTPAYVVTPAITSQQNDGQIADDVEKGVEAANAAQNTRLDQMNSYLSSIASKEWSVNVYPTAGWGLFNRASGAAAEKVTGTGG